MDGLILALDQGTTGSTALVVDRNGTVVGRAYSELTQHYPHPGWVEQDPEELWQTSRRVMIEAIHNAGKPVALIRGIGITNQRETTILWDKTTAQPVHRAIVWQSRQTAEICDRLRKSGLEKTIRQRTGLVLDPYFSASKIVWLFEQYPDLRSRANSGQILFGTVDSWLLWRLTGGSVHATDPTNASRTLLYNIHDHDWDTELLNLLDIPSSILPTVKPSSGVFGETVPQDSLPGGVPIAGMAGDQQAALYGQNCWEPGETKNTYGTGAFVVMQMGQHHPILDHGLLTTVCCDSHGRPAYAVEGSIFTAGAAIQWLRDGLNIIEQADETESLAESVPDTAGVYLVPAFTGLGVPYWDMHARGAIIGLTRGTDRRHLARATLESIAYQTRDVVDIMRQSKVDVTVLKVDGGAAANDFLMQFQADILGVNVDRPTVLETTGTGVAFLAGLAVGLWKTPDAIRHLYHRERLFTPRMSKSKRDAQYSGWRDAVSRILSTN